MFDRRYRASVAFMNIKVIDGGRSAPRHRGPRSRVVNPECAISRFTTPRGLASPRPRRRRLCRRPSHGAACSPCESPIPSSKPIMIGSPLAPSPVEHLYLAQTPQVFRRELSFRVIRFSGSRHWNNH